MNTFNKVAMRDECVDLLHDLLTGKDGERVRANLNGPMIAILQSSDSPGEAAARMVDTVIMQQGGTKRGHERTREMLDDLASLSRTKRTRKATK